MGRLALYLMIYAIGLGAALGCSDETPTVRVERVEMESERAAAQAAATAKQAGSTLEGNLEDSAGVYEKAYEKARDAGDGVVDASGDAYNAVLDETDEKRQKQE